MCQSYHGSLWIQIWRQADFERKSEASFLSNRNDHQHVLLTGQFFVLEFNHIRAHFIEEASVMRYTENSMGV
jgi:hypothetical protein